MWLEGIARMGPHNHPEITLTGIAMHEAMIMMPSPPRQSRRRASTEREIGARHQLVSD